MEAWNGCSNEKKYAKLNTKAMEGKTNRKIKLTNSYKGILCFYEPMAEHTSLGLGGAADIYAVPNDLDSLKFLLKVAYDNSIPVLPIGHGTNLLIKDGGIRGIVLSLKSFRRFEVLDNNDNSYIYAAVGAGVPLGRFIQFTAKTGFSGLEGLAGIPGSVGGGVFMNAGSFGAEIGDCVVVVDILEKDGSKRTLNGRELSFSYRNSSFHEGSIIVEVKMRLKKDLPQSVKARVREFLERKKTTQPLELPSAGCVFKNTDGKPAGRLLDLSGCKGMKIGNTEISSLHANFFINRGNSASDFLDLMSRASERVRKRFGIELKPEIQIIGEDRV